MRASEKKPPRKKAAVWDGSEPDHPESWSYPQQRNGPPPRLPRRSRDKRQPFVTRRRDWWNDGR